MDEEPKVELETTPEPAPQAPPAEPAPAAPPAEAAAAPAKAGGSGMIIAVVAIAVVAIVVIAFVFMGGGAGHEIEGKWNMQSADVSMFIMDQWINETTEFTDGWIEFKSGGGMDVGGTDADDAPIGGTATWEETADGEITITDGTTSLVMDYVVNGNNLELSYTFSGATMTIHLTKA